MSENNETVERTHNLHKHVITNSRLPIPTFAIDSENITILESPQQFYDTLINKIKSSKNRIILSSLYIGDDNLSRGLIKVIGNQLEKMGELNVQILLDRNRALRSMNTKKLSMIEINPNEYSMNLMVNMVNKYNGRFNVFLCDGTATHQPTMWQTPSYTLKNYIGEIRSVHHIKLFIFDNDVMISGANISKDYFTCRYDRYIVLERQRCISDFLVNFIEIYSRYSTKITTKAYQGIVVNNNPKQMAKELYDLQKLLEYNYLSNAHNCDTTMDHITTNNKLSTSNLDTLLSIYISFPKLNLFIEKQMMNLIFSLPITYKRSMLDILIMTSYLNLPVDNLNDLKSITQPFDLTIITSHLSNNAFFNDDSIKKWVATCYSLQLEEIITHTLNNHDKIGFLEYISDKESFHGKGIWIFDKTLQQIDRSDSLLLHIAGSSNYGYRSQYRDCELNFMFSTSSKLLKQNLSKDHDRIIRNCKKPDLISFKQRHQYVPTLVRLFRPIIKYFL